MLRQIEDYAVIGNCETLALVARSGSIDWLPVAQFDRAACFCSLLGDVSHGRWLIEPEAKGAHITRRYCGETLVLETTFRTDDGTATLTDFMFRRHGASDVVRIVKGVEGEVRMRMELIVRFGIGLWCGIGASLPQRAQGGARFSARRSCCFRVAGSCHLAKFNLRAALSAHRTSTEPGQEHLYRSAPASRSL
jgi:hypothetical protein